MEAYNRNLESASMSFGLRLTPRFLHPRFDAIEEELKRLPAVTLQNLCRKTIRRGVQPEEDEAGTIDVIKTMQLKNGRVDLSEAGKVSEEFLVRFNRARVVRGDVLISSTGEGRGKVDLYDADEHALADSHISIVSLRHVADGVWLAPLLRSRFGRHQLKRIEMAVKSTPELYADQIGLLRIPAFTNGERTRISAKIRAIEDAISAERARLKAPVDVVNEILCAEFKYPLRKHIARAREKNYVRQFSAIGDGYSLRNSVKFHHPHFDLTEHFFASTSHESVKAFLRSPIRLGVTASKSDFVEDGDALYVHPGATKREEVIVAEDCHRVTAEFFDKNRRRFGLQRGDVILNRSGEGTIGKSGYFDLSEDALFADFTMRVRFHKDRMCPRFGWYYFRSVMFQSQVEREKRGMGNMTNIFPSQVERMLVPACEHSRQKAVASQIDAELATLARSHAAIEKRHVEMEMLMDDAVRGVRNRRS